MKSRENLAAKVIRSQPLAGHLMAKERKKMRSYSVTDVGRIRSVNQDYVFASERSVGRLPNLFVVADGMGGHNAGDRASSYAVEVMLQSIRRDDREKNPVRIIRRAIETANEKVLKESNAAEDFYGMGTTLVAATIVKDTLYVANVGDSRLYLLRDNGKKLRQITRDHSLVEEMVRMGELTAEQGRNHPDKNIITRAVGVSQRLMIDFFDVKLEKGDTILMCSDGLSNMLEDAEMEEIICREKDLQNAGNQLVEAANRNGGRDNISVVLVNLRTDEVRSC